jgi:hypothetical protein
MKWLLFTVCIVTLTQQPAKPPETARTPNSKRSQVSKQTDSSGDHHNVPQEALPTQTIIQQVASPDHYSNAHDANAKAREPSPDYVVIFTGMLALIGVLQVIVMFMQWCIYRRQAREMRRQRFEMARQRHEIWRQRGIMRSQLKAMEDQAAQMVAQTDVLERSVRVAKVSSDIAARVSIPTLKIHKFEASKAAATSVFAFLQFPKFEITVKNYGQTPAFLKFWTLKISCEDLPKVPVYSEGENFGVLLEKQVVPSGELFTLPELQFYQRDRLSIEDVQAVIDQTKEFRVYGFICYEDIFGNPLQRLKFCEFLLNILGEYLEFTEASSTSAYVGTDLYPTTR